MANAGLSVKERLALLQNNNNNNNTSSNNHNATSKPAPVSPKPKPSPAETKPPGIAGFKPVTPSKPIAPQSHKPGTDKPTPSPPDKPPTANKPVTASKPALGTKPSPAAKPFTAAAAASSKPGVEETGWPKLRHAGTGKETTAPSPPVSQQSVSSSCEPGGETPAVPAAPSNSSQEAGDSAMSSQRQEETPGRAVITPLKPVSVQERLAAFRQKSLEAECKDLKPKHHNGVSPTSQSTSTPKPSSVFPPSPVSGTLNGQPPDSSTESKSELQGIKRSDIAKSLTHAADRILRNKTAAPTADAVSEDAAPQRRSHLFQRRSDGKKFRKLDVPSLTPSEPAPAKPSRIDNVDLKPFLKAYATAKEKKLEVDAGQSGAAAEGEGEEGEMEELYIEAESSSVTIRGRKGSGKRATTARVSLIPEYTEEEEEQELYTDGTSGSSTAVPFPSEPEETYDDCQSAVETQKQPEPALEEPDEIYEPLDEGVPENHDPASSESIPPPLPSPNTPDDKKAREKDKENKEKEELAKKKDKAKEEANKKEEKERKKKEEDLKKMRRKFGLNDSHEKVGDGVVKSNASGGVFSKDLAVVRGETIAILRIDGNPAGKWLAQNEQGKIGFVNSNNIEISTPTIKHLMAGVKHETAPTEEEPEEMYEALPEGEMDEIYEEL